MNSSYSESLHHWHISQIQRSRGILVLAQIVLGLLIRWPQTKICELLPLSQMQSVKHEVPKTQHHEHPPDVLAKRDQAWANSDADGMRTQ
jgi:hypothetical protein